MDIFIEKIVARKKTMLDTAFAALMMLAGFVVVLVVFNVPQLSSYGLLLTAGIVYVTFRFITSRNIEYEYSVTNGDLDIDTIISQRKRKRIFSASCKDFDIVARRKSDKYSGDVMKIAKRIEAISSLDSEDVFFAVLNYKGEKTIVFFKPDERILNSFTTFIPRKVFS